MTRKSFKDKLSEIIIEKKYLKLNIVPYDTKFYMIYFERKKTQSKNLIRRNIMKGTQNKNK